MAKEKKPYQIFPAMTAEERKATKESIRLYGVLDPVHKDADGNILDGHHRVEIWEELVAAGEKLNPYPVIEHPELTTDQQKLAFAWDANWNRRHLTPDQRRALIKKKCKEKEFRELSSNALAKLIGVSDKTVTSVREEMYTNEELKRPEKTKGADGKERRQPQPRAKKPKPEDASPPPSVPVPNAGAGTSDESEVENGAGQEDEPLINEHFSPYSQESGAERMESSPEGLENIRRVIGHTDTGSRSPLGGWGRQARNAFLQRNYESQRAILEAIDGLRRVCLEWKKEFKEAQKSRHEESQRMYAEERIKRAAANNTPAEVETSVETVSEEPETPTTLSVDRDTAIDMLRELGLPGAETFNKWEMTKQLMKIPSASQESPTSPDAYKLFENIKKTLKAKGKLLLDGDYPKGSDSKKSGKKKELATTAK